MSHPTPAAAPAPDAADGATPQPSPGATGTLPLAVLDFVGIEHGESAHDALQGAIRVAQAVEAAGLRRYWVSEHHNMQTLACSAPEILVAAVAARTTTLRVGAAGIMLPNHAPFKVAETFRTLLGLYPGRIDLGLGRAPGTDPLTAHVLRRGAQVDVGSEFPGQVAELLAFLGDGFPEGHPYGRLVAAPVVDEKPPVFVLGSSPYGPQFAAINGLRTVFAHHMSPDLAIDALRRYRAEFRPGPDGAGPWSAMSVLAFASDDEQAIGEFEAGWSLTMQNLARNIREPLRPEDVRTYAASSAFASRRLVEGPDQRMVTGPADVVVDRLRDLQQRAQVDELVLVTPSIDRDRRIASLEAIATAWPR
ncbi:MULTISPECIES: LLM class flavin-dependent oxidoreductase [unclassified Actinotalea]|uniref:LLM class flavin-dependent oxidoreductase n=1 Tax=unclassified Actinotalea TaxID=2638618 RepID=UPI0015F5E1D9|nr:MULTISPECIES: LLM class flavin-dependent oxidoreductase [unclassified Actinotalea]